MVVEGYHIKTFFDLVIEKLATGTSAITCLLYPTPIVLIGW
jgi:hypothetical protein